MLLREKYGAAQNFIFIEGIANIKSVFNKSVTAT